MKLYEISNWGEDWGDDDDSIDTPYVSHRIQRLTTSASPYQTPTKKKVKLTPEEQIALNKRTLHLPEHANQLKEFNKLVDQMEQESEIDHAWWRFVDNLVWDTGREHGGRNRSPYHSGLTRYINAGRRISAAINSWDLQKLQTNIEQRQAIKRELTDLMKANGVDVDEKLESMLRHVRYLNQRKQPK